MKTAKRGRGDSRVTPSAIAEAILWLLVLAVPLWFVPTARDAFRLPKLMLGEGLALASLIPLARTLPGLTSLDPRRLWKQPVLRAVLPLVLVATAGLLWSGHPIPVRRAVTDLWIGAAALVGWSLGLEGRRLERLLRGLVVPGTALAALAILQFYGYRPLGLDAVGRMERVEVISLAGNPGDLAGFLVLAALIAQWSLIRVQGRRRVLIASALTLTLFALVLTQTFAALIAMILGSGLLWWLLLPRRRAAAIVAAVLAATVLAGLAVPPLRARIGEKVGDLVAGEWNTVLTGRLDGWRAALQMAGEEPWTGVGHGAYRAEFGAAKLVLVEKGVSFYRGQRNVIFANAHNEFLEVVAETGLPGLLALAWGLWVLLGQAHRVSRLPRVGGDGEAAGKGEGRARRAVTWALLLVLLALSLAQFPFRIALTAFPALLFLAWIFVGEAGEAES